MPLPPYTQELARLKQAAAEIKQDALRQLPVTVNFLSLNPSLRLIKLSWQNLPDLLQGKKTSLPNPGEEHVLLYYGVSGVKIESASANDLLAIKLMAEDISREDAAREGEVVIGVIDQIMAAAVQRGFLLQPASKIRREPNSYPKGQQIPADFFNAEIFTLQWHITQTCDLHCKHCYDRSDRAPLALDQGLKILDDLRSFCLANHVRGQVSFSGGNPLLYPHFFELYQAAVDRNLQVAILGNPASRTVMEKIVTIERPAFYQVSLEGLEDQNDFIRGPGHFKRIIKFLALLKDLQIYSMVMLTLTRDNLNQVIPLAAELRGKADEFTYNRLAMVGEGAALLSVKPEDYATFVEEYVTAAQTNPVISLKDNLININRRQHDLPPFGGCAGFGCGAAFNFFSILPDGEAHACRKLPSYIGNAFEQSIGEIYYNDKARQYRAGTSACSTCDIRPVCGGCLAVTHGFGLNIFQDKDPYCWLCTD
jgi:selenobiotic family peptide radical SAM maturase